MKTQSAVPLCGIILLSAARPTSPASDQTKGGIGRVYREHRGSVPESGRFDLTKIQLSSTKNNKFPKSLKSHDGEKGRQKEEEER